jgi:hypothetical protein
MQKSNKPDTELYLPRDLFNALMTALDYFIAAEDEIGETTQTKQAALLKEKILTHGRAFDNKGEDNASIYFYGVEAAVVIKLLTIYIELGDESTADYFPELKQRRKQNKSGGVGGSAAEQSA